MIRDFINSAIEKKNTIMFVTSLFFITGIASFFNGCEIISAAFITLICIFVLWKNKISYKFIILWLLIFYAGFFNAYLRIKNSDELAKVAPLNAQITGRIVSIPNSNQKDKTKFFFNVDNVNGQNIDAKTYVTISSDDNDFSTLNIGNRYKIKAKLRLPFKAGNPSQFDYGKYLRNFDTFTLVYAEKSDCEFLKGELPLKWKLMQGLNNVRNRIIDEHSKYLKSPNLEILGGIVFGDDAVAPPDYIKDSFTNSGLLHILAASGMNVAFIFGFWFYILSIFKVPYKPRVLSGMGVIILYTLMTGLGASVIRAALMLLFVLIGKLIDRDSHSVALLSFVAMLMLIYNPAFINDVGFQLSFLVTFGIICTANILINKFKGGKVREFLAGTLLIPIVAQIWVIPLQMFYFNTISTYSFFANVSIMPFLSVISFGGFVSSVLAVITPIADFVCKTSDFILNIFLNILVWISNFFSTLPSSLLETPHPSVLQVFIYYIIVLLLTLMIKEGFTKRHVALAAGLILFLLLTTVKIPDGKLEIITFDVGNADAFLIKTPENKYIIIDTGKSGYAGGKSQGEFIIRKYLKDRGIKEVELMIITHFDNDHAGGAADIMKKTCTGTVLVNSLSDKSKTAEKIYKTAQNIKAAQDDKIVYEEPDLTLRTFVKKSVDDNESSIITLLTHRDFEMLFTGDAGIDGITRISDKIPDNLEVFKAGHHGAANIVDNRFLKEHSPAVSIISVGKNNYGHPNAATLDLLKDTEIYRTDKNNSIRILTDGNEYQMSTFNTDSKKYEPVTTKLAK